MQELITQYSWVIYAVVAWTLPWKGVALWRAANNKHKIWFVVIFLINTLAILDIIYIFFFSKKKEVEDGARSNGPTILSNGKRIV